MSTQWVDIENSIQSAVAQATQLATDDVIWKWQDYNAPNYTYATIDLGQVITVGQDYVRYQTDLSRPLGQEIKQTVKGIREVPLEIEVFSNSVTGNSSAKAILERARTALRLPSIKYGLRNGGIAPFDPGPVNNVPFLPSVNFRGRAHCTVRCYVVMPEVVEYCTYIARVRGSVQFYRAFSGGSGGIFIFDTANA